MDFRLYFPKSISTLLIVILIANMALFAVIFHPKQAEAAIFHDAIAVARDTIEFVWKVAKGAYERVATAASLNFDAYEKAYGNDGIIVQAVSLTLALALHQLLAKMTNDIIAWINGGYRGKPRIMQDFGKALEDSLDEAGGVVMGAITGLDPKTLCDASWLKLKLAPAFGGPFAVPTFEEKVACTFSGMAEGLRKFKEDFRNGGWQSFVKYAEKQNNRIGVTLLVAEKYAEEQKKAKNNFVAETTAGRGYLAQKKCYITKASNMTLKHKILDSDLLTRDFGYGTQVESGFGPRFDNNLNLKRGMNLGTKLDSGLGTQSNSGLSETGYSGSDFVGANIEDVAKEFGYSDVEEFRKLWVSNGGAVDCKIQTPAEQISELATTAMQGPIRAIEKAQSDMLEKIGDKAPAVLKPYVIAIGATLLNDVTKRGKGLIASAFMPPKKNRKSQQPSTKDLQNNTALAQSAGATAASANDFRSFLLKAAIDFNQYIGNISRVMDESDVLGRTQINKIEFDIIGGKYQAKSGDSLQTQVLDIGYGPTNTDTPLKSPDREYAGWLTNADCNEPGDINNNIITADKDHDNIGKCLVDGKYSLWTGWTAKQGICALVKPPETATTTFAIATCDKYGNEGVPTQKIYTTYAAGKTFYNEAKWCGAYSQELPIPFANEQKILEAKTGLDPYIVATGGAVFTSKMGANCPAGGSCDQAADAVYYNLDGDSDYEMRTRLYGYDDDDDDEPDRFIRIKTVGEDVNGDGTPDAPITASGAHQFAETIINSYSDLNENNIIDKISANPADAATIKPIFDQYPISNQYSMPLFDESNNRNELILPAMANNGSVNYLFGGYNQYGFSDRAINLSADTIVNHFPVWFAGAQAVYYPPNGRIYIFGGMDYNGLLDTIFEFSPQNGTIRTMSAKLPEKTTGLSGAYFAGTGKIYLFGGSTANGVRNWILEYNQQTDSVVRMNAVLPAPIANSAAIVSSPTTGQQRIYIIGGKNENGLAQSSITEYNPRVEDNSLAAIVAKRSKTVPRAYHAAYLKKPANPREIVIYGGQDENGLVANKEEFDPISDYISNRMILDNAASGQEHRSQMGFTEKGAMTGGIKRDSASQSYPQGDVYYIPQRVEAVETREFMWQKYFSSKFENGSVSLMNFKESVVQKDPTATILNPYTRRETNTNSDEVWMAPPFYPEILEDAQELMEKVRVIRGYNYNKPWERNYTAALPLQLGAIPDDDPTDNRLFNYEGSVSDVLLRYSELTKIYQMLFSGITEESSLESVDPNMMWLTPEETNIKLSLIGQRCPAIQPTATSTPDLIAKCPPLGAELGNQYNMQKRFVFEPDGFNTEESITTGFATNPFNNKKSSAMAGVLNLDEMATQLQTASPDTNLVKLIRLRQILEQLQVPIAGASSTTVPILLAGKNKFINPKAFSGVDVMQVDIPGYEKIQEYLNDTDTRNLDIQTLIKAYGYTTAKEAYPEISKDLDNVWQDIVNQTTDKLKDVFFKRTEKELETARSEAQNRMTKFIEYVRDANPKVRYEFNSNDAGRIGSLINNLNKEYIKTYQASADTDVLEIDSSLMFKNQSAMDVLLARDSNGKPKELSLSNDDRNAIIGTAAYKIKSLAKFIGIDIFSEQFGARMSQYTSDISGNPLMLDARVKNILKDVYLYYSGIYNFTDPLLENSTDKTMTLIPSGALLLDNPVGCYLLNSSNYDGYRCNLTTYEKNGTHHVLNKDAKTKLDELTEDFELMLTELDSTKAEYHDLSGKVKERGNDMDEMANLLSALEADYDKANACIGMPTDQNNLWKFGAAQVLSEVGKILLPEFTWQGVGTAILATLAITILGPVGLAIVGFFGFGNAKKKAEEKYRKQMAKIANDCKEGIRNYNKHLGQLADMFLCNQQNPIYKDDAGQ